MTFVAPAWWWLLPPLLVYLWWLSRRSYAQLVPWAKWGALVLRGLILVLVAAGLSQPVFFRRSPGEHIVYLLDVSRSVSGENHAAAMADIQRLSEEAERANSDTRFSLIAFGRDTRLMAADQADWPGWTDDLKDSLLYQTTLPALEAERAKLIGAGRAAGDEDLQRLDLRISAVRQFRDQVAGDRTDVVPTARLAMNVGSRELPRTIYLFTDGNFNSGKWESAWSAKSDGDATRVHVVKLNVPSKPEVALTEIAVPEKVRINEGFSARVRVAASADTQGELAVFKDGYAVESREIKIAQGSNTFDVPGLSFRDKGFHSVEAVVRAKDDAQLENNRRRSIVVVPGPVRVLYVEGDDAQIAYLKNALEVEGMQVEARPAAGVPTELSELLGFDVFILSNVPADKLSLAQMEMVRTYVEQSGGGFIMLGGDESFGLGGYYGTPIEEILPVRMPIERDLNRPSLAIVMVIDKSGSMEGAKIQLAKRAAIATSEVINLRDQVGLVGFDSESRVLLQLTSASDRATIASNIAALDADGGTMMYPALQDAQRMLQASDARRKHVIVLSDGQTAGDGYDALASAMAADGLTVSTVGIGDGADMNLLQMIAATGGGQAYFTSDFSRIPQIFTREALRASKSMLVEKLVQPSVIADDVCLKEIDADEIPLLMGYVATTAKDVGRTIMVSDSGDPILAKMRYGLGWTAAFTSEPKPRWAEDWIEWPNFAKFWSQLVRSLTTQGRESGIAFEATHRLDGESVVVTADVRDGSGNFLDSVEVASSSFDALGHTQLVDVDHTGPGLFEARIPLVEYGQPQHMIWTLTVSQQQPQPVPYGFVYSCSPEFQTMGVDEQALRHIAEQGGGETMSVGAVRYLPHGSGSRERVSLWPYLLSAALLLVPADILCRRLG